MSLYPPLSCCSTAKTVNKLHQGSGCALQEKDPELFYMARVGLGCLGVVSELTLKCVPAHELLQHTQVMTRQQVHQQHQQLLQSNKHLRYMWLPYTDSVVVVTCNPQKEVQSCMPPASRSFPLLVMISHELPISIGTRC